MAERIKKTIPWFLVLALISVVIVAGLNLGKPQAEAEGVPATVTVGNVVPAFTEDVPDDSSVCSTPINVGSDVTFTATATDANNDQWKLLVCKTDGTSGTDCDGGESDRWCVSASAVNSGQQNSCSYTVTAGDYNNGTWYAYACDNVGCSANSNAASPFYVNREPNFTAVNGATADPGSNVVFTTTASDPDYNGDGCPADEVKLYICATSGADSDGCTGTQLCAASLTGSNPTCNYEVPIPTAHGNYNYYPYIFDTHGMPAGGAKQGVAAQYAVNDVAPSITTVTLNGGATIVLGLKPGTTNVSAISTDVYDPNGYGDITGVSAVIYRTSKGADGGADNNYRYPVASCVDSECSGATCTYTCTAAFKYYADPTDGSSGYSGDTWSAKMTASDETGSGSQTSSAVELQTNTALAVTEAGINYDTVPAGQDTGSDNETTTVVNYGNSPIDTNLYGVDMEKVENGVSIDVEQQKYNLITFTYSEGGTALIESPGVDVDTATTKPTTDDDVSAIIYWGIGIPELTPSGDYAGTNTFSAVIDEDDWPG